MATGLIQLGNWLLLIGALLFILAVLNAVRAGRQLSSAAYYVVRQEALSRTRRWTFLATIALLSTSGLAMYLSNLPAPTAVANVPTPSAVLVAIPSRILPTATSTPQPTQLPSKTPLPTATATPTLLPKATALPAVNVPAILQTPMPSAVPVSPNAKLAFTTLASIVDSKGTPSDPGLAFPAGTRNVRLFFQASNVNNGATWSVLCYKGNKIVDSYIDLWDWGPRSQTARAYCAIDGSPGAYTVAAYLGFNQQFAIAFELLPATPTPFPPVTP